MKQSTKTNLPAEPTEAEWRALYAAAEEFIRVAPWNWMYDSDLFGVQDPESGEVGYCCVLGNAGEAFGLNVFQGGDGLMGFWAMAMVTPETIEEVGKVQRCLSFSLEDRANLRPKDLAQIKSLGLKYRGQNAWPMFFSMVPGYLPWHLTGPEARFLTVALQQTLDVAARFHRDPNLLPPPEGPGLGEYLVRVPAKTHDGYQWTDALQPAPPPALGEAVEISWESDRVAHLCKTLPRTNLVIEIDYFSTPHMPVGVKGERPYIPHVILFVASGSGLILNVGTVSIDGLFQECVDNLLDMIEGTGALPEAIHVRRPMLHSLLSDVGGDLGIPCLLKKRLPGFSNAYKSFSQFGRGLGL